MGTRGLWVWAASHLLMVLSQVHDELQAEPWHSVAFYKGKERDTQPQNQRASMENTPSVMPLRPRLRVGIIGAGRIGRIHAQSLTRAGAAVTIIADPLEEAAHRASQEFGIARWTPRAEDVIHDPNIDAVVICSPTDQHAKQIIQAAQQGKDIFCEKPIALTLEAVEEALQAVKAANVKLMIGFNRRFDANFMRVRQAIDTGELGKVTMVRITSRDPGAPPIEYVKNSGGMFKDMTIHDFDMARFLVQDEVVEVFAMAQCHNQALAAVGDIDASVCLLKFRNGAMAYIDNSREAAYGYDQRVEVLGSKGSAQCDNNYQNNVVLSTGRAVQRDLPLHFFLERYMDAYIREMHTFINVCLDQQPVPVSGIDGREALRLAMAANLSLKENRPVRLSELTSTCM